MGGKYANECPRADGCSIAIYCVMTYRDRKFKNGKPVCCGTCKHLSRGNCPIETGEGYSCWISKEGWKING